MSRRLKQVTLGFLVVVVAAQLIRPNRTNPPTDEGRTLLAQVGTASGLVVVLDRSCGDCHSNNTVWPWYTEIAPLSWLMAYAVNEGRKVMNFSEWTAYGADQQQTLLAQSCGAASQGTMPGAYTWVRPATKLSAQDIEVICAAPAQHHAILSQEGTP